MSQDLKKIFESFIDDLGTSNLRDSLVNELLNEFQTQIQSSVENSSVTEDEVPKLRTTDLFRSLQNTENLFRKQVDQFVTQFLTSVIRKITVEQSTQTIDATELNTLLSQFNKQRQSQSGSTISPSILNDSTILVRVEENISLEEPIVVERTTNNILVIKNVPKVENESTSNRLLVDQQKRIPIISKDLRVEFDNKITSGNNIFEFKLQQNLLTITNLQNANVSDDQINLQKQFKITENSPVFKKILGLPENLSFTGPEYLEDSLTSSNYQNKNGAGANYIETAIETDQIFTPELKNIYEKEENKEQDSFSLDDSIFVNNIAEEIEEAENFIQKPQEKQELELSSMPCQKQINQSGLQDKDFQNHLSLIDRIEDSLLSDSFSLETKENALEIQKITLHSENLELDLATQNNCKNSNEVDSVTQNNHENDLIPKDFAQSLETKEEKEESLQEIESTDLLQLIRSTKNHRLMQIKTPVIFNEKKNQLIQQNVEKGETNDKENDVQVLKKITAQLDNDENDKLRMNDEEIKQFVARFINESYESLQREFDSTRSTLSDIENLYTKFKELLDNENDYTEFVDVFLQLIDLDQNSLQIDKIRDKLNSFISKQNETIDLLKTENIRSQFRVTIEQQALELDNFSTNIVDSLDKLKSFYENEQIIEIINSKYDQNYFKKLKVLNNEAKLAFYRYVEFENLQALQPVKDITDRLQKSKISLLQLQLIIENDNTNKLKKIRDTADIDQRLSVLQHSEKMIGIINSANLEISDYNILSFEQNIGFLPTRIEQKRGSMESFSDKNRRTMFIVLPKGNSATFYVRNENENPRHFMLKNDSEVVFENIRFDSGINKTVALISSDNFQRINNSFIIMVIDDNDNTVFEKNQITESLQQEINTKMQSSAPTNASFREVYRILRLDIIPTLIDLDISIDTTNSAISKIQFDEEQFDKVWVFYKIFDKNQDEDQLYEDVSQINIENYFPRQEKQTESRWKRIIKEELSFLNRDLERKDFWLMYTQMSKIVESPTSARSTAVRSSIQFKRITFDINTKTASIDSSISAVSSIGGYLYNSIGSFANFEFGNDTTAFKSGDDDEIDEETQKELDYSAIISI